MRKTMVILISGCFILSCNSHKNPLPGGSKTFVLSDTMLKMTSFAKGRRTTLKK